MIPYNNFGDKLTSLDGLITGTYLLQVQLVGETALKILAE